MQALNLTLEQRLQLSREVLRKLTVRLQDYDLEFEELDFIPTIQISGKYDNQRKALISLKRSQFMIVNSLRNTSEHHDYNFPNTDSEIVKDIVKKVCKLFPLISERLN
jgi:hypothetical protein